jgi:hypothetical protein
MCVGSDSLSQMGSTAPRSSINPLSDKGQQDAAARQRRNLTTASLRPVVKPILDFLCGDAPQKKDLMTLARDLYDSTGLLVDRIARRHFDGVVTWFCENWRTIEPAIQSLPRHGPGAYDSRFKLDPPRPPVASPVPSPDPWPDPLPFPSPDPWLISWSDDAVDLTFMDE